MLLLSPLTSAGGRNQEAEEFVSRNTAQDLDLTADEAIRQLAAYWSRMLFVLMKLKSNPASTPFGDYP